ncbi:MAG: hypothetical protein ACRCT8_11545 [Lacipirellulaceae bacterium]
MAKPEQAPENPLGNSFEGVEIPLATQRALDNCLQSFEALLQQGTWASVVRRGSVTPTDADVENAFRDLVENREGDWRARLIGDAVLVAGGVFIPLWSIHWSMTVAGVLLALVGLFVREFRS